MKYKIGDCVDFFPQWLKKTIEEYGPLSTSVNPIRSLVISDFIPDHNGYCYYRLIGLEVDIWAGEFEINLSLSQEREEKIDKILNV